MAGRIGAGFHNAAVVAQGHEAREREDALVSRWERRFDKLPPRQSDGERARLAAAMLAQPKKPGILDRMALRAPAPVPYDGGYFAIIARASRATLGERMDACLPHVGDNATRQYVVALLCAVPASPSGLHMFHFATRALLTRPSLLPPLMAQRLDAAGHAAEKRFCDDQDHLEFLLQVSECVTEDPLMLHVQDAVRALLAQTCGGLAHAWVACFRNAPLGWPDAFHVPTVCDWVARLGEALGTSLPDSMRAFTFWHPDMKRVATLKGLALCGVAPTWMRELLRQEAPTTDLAAAQGAATGRKESAPMQAFCRDLETLFPGGPVASFVTALARSEDLLAALCLPPLSNVRLLSMAVAWNAARVALQQRDLGLAVEHLWAAWRHAHVFDDNMLEPLRATTHGLLSAMDQSTLFSDDLPVAATLVPQVRELLRLSGASAPVRVRSFCAWRPNIERLAKLQALREGVGVCDLSAMLAFLIAIEGPAHTLGKPALCEELLARAPGGITHAAVSFAGGCITLSSTLPLQNDLIGLLCEKLTPTLERDFESNHHARLMRRLFVAPWQPAAITTAIACYEAARASNACLETLNGSQNLSRLAFSSPHDGIVVFPKADVLRALQRIPWTWPAHFAALPHMRELVAAGTFACCEKLTDWQPNGPRIRLYDDILQLLGNSAPQVRPFIQFLLALEGPATRFELGNFLDRDRGIDGMTVIKPVAGYATLGAAIADLVHHIEHMVSIGVDAERRIVVHGENVPRIGQFILSAAADFAQALRLYMDAHPGDAKGLETWMMGLFAGNACLDGWVTGLYEHLEKHPLSDGVQDMDLVADMTRKNTDHERCSEHVRVFQNRARRDARVLAGLPPEAGPGAIEASEPFACLNTPERFRAYLVDSEFGAGKASWEIDALVAYQVDVVGVF